MPNGLTGLTGYSSTAAEEATPEQKYGDTVDPRHAAAGPETLVYEGLVSPGEPHGPYGTENGLLGMAISSSAGGVLADDPTADRQPLTHAAPWPKGVDTTVSPDTEADSLKESAEIHGSGYQFGLSRRAYINPASMPKNDDWQTEADLVDPGSFVRPLAEVSAQQKGQPIGGFGQRDRTQSFAEQNSYGFDSAHVQRRRLHGSLPGNFLWQKGGFRPLVSQQVGPAGIPTGEQSYFTGQSGKRGYGPEQSVLYTLPQPYTPPPEPAQAPAVSAPVTPGRVRLW